MCILEVKPKFGILRIFTSAGLCLMEHLEVNFEDFCTIFCSAGWKFNFKPGWTHKLNFHDGKFGSISNFHFNPQNLVIFRNFNFQHFASECQHQKFWWKFFDEKICEKIWNKFRHHQFSQKCVPNFLRTHVACYFFLDRTLYLYKKIRFADFFFLCVPCVLSVPQ